MSTGSALTRAFLTGGMIAGRGARVRNRDKLIGSPGSDTARLRLRGGATTGADAATDAAAESIVAFDVLHRGVHARPTPCAR